MTPVNSSFDDDERALARALHGRVDHMNDSPLGFQDVNSAARGIRRRRRIVAAAGVAAAVAIIVPTAIVAGGFFDQDSPTPPVTSQSPTGDVTPSESPSPSSPPTTAPRSQVLDVSGLSTGAAPGLAYAELDYVDGVARGGTIHGADGTETPLPEYQLNAFAPLGTGYVLDMWDPDTETEQVLSIAPDGSSYQGWQASGGLAVSDGGNVVAWTGVDGQVYAAHAETGDVLTMPSIPGPGPYRTIGVTSEDCQEGRTTDGGCTVFVSTNGQHPRAWYTTSHGIVDRLPGLLGVSTSDATHVAGVTSIDETEPGSCSRMLQDFDQELWTTCDNNLGTISPDGSMLVGLPDYLDGFGPNTLDVLDMADGTSLRSWTSTARSATYFDEVWEDDSHLLVVAYQGGDWAVVRLGTDGSMEYAVPPVTGQDLERPLVLQTR
jgi:hypothetical protein